ncbi:MAG: caspase family protein [Kofleriaceae bacterium]
MIRTWFACLVVLACYPRVSAADGARVAYAIVIGNNAPPRSGTTEVLQPLRYADDDAIRYFQLFSRFAQTQLLVVADEPTQRRYPDIAARAMLPTLANLRRVVAALAVQMKRDREHGDKPILYFAFSGHGARDDHGGAFLALLDEPLTQDVLYDLIGGLPTEFTHVIVDACNAGGVVGVRGGTGFFTNEGNTQTAPTTAADVEPILEATPLANHPNIGVILATTLGQESHEWSALESGVFTHELLSGLAGAADVNGDLVIEYSEIQAFVASANRDIKDPRAIPQIIARPPAANLREPLIALRSLAGTHLVRGEASKLGHFYVELDNGQRYLDAHPDRGSTISFAVPDATPAYLRTADAEVSLPVRGAIALADLVLGPRAVGSRGSIDTAYQRSLFASGYGRAYYQGFVDSTGSLGVTFPDERDETPTRPRGRGLALGLATFAGGSAVVSVTAGVLAYQARSDFEATTLQRPADAARQRYARDLPISIATGVTAVAAGVAAYWLWPRSSVQVMPAAAGGGYGLGMEMTW